MRLPAGLLPGIYGGGSYFGSVDYSRRSGDAEQSLLSDKYFVSHLNQRKRLLYIPIAMDQTVYTYSECYSWVRSVFEPLGLTDIDMITDLSSIDYDIIDKYPAVYIGGGNTFHLLNEVRRSGFDSKVKAFVAEGGIVYGGSAGAIILGSDIGTAAYADPNNVMIEDLKGLDLLGGHAVWCHYHREQDELISNFVDKTERKVMAIPEASGISFDLSKFRNIGSESCYIFIAHRNKQEVGVGAQFDQNDV